MIPEKPGLSTISEKDRAVQINQMVVQGYNESLSILQADFGHWPPLGLDIVNAPDYRVTLKKYTAIFSFTTAYVDNAEPSHKIYFNRAASLFSSFNMTSRTQAETLSHEHIHILQKAQMRRGLSDPFGRNKRHKLDAFIKPSAQSFAKYLCEEDEVQVRLHQLVSSHYRATQTLPLTPHELFAMLKAQGVQCHSEWAESLLTEEKGIAARRRFSTPPALDKSGARQDLNTIFKTIRADKCDAYCRDIIPALYGQLLELYGDRLGCQRMGFSHNLSLTEVFFRQAWSLQYAQKELTSPPDTRGIEKTLALMPVTQVQDLRDHLLNGKAYQHPITLRKLGLEPPTIQLIMPFISRHSGPSSPPYA